MNYYFASIDSNNIVDQVQIVAEEHCLDNNGNFNEQLGAFFCLKNFGGSRWLRTCPNRSIRYNYAGVGHTYDQENDAFIEPKFNDDYILQSDFTWTPASVIDIINTEEIL
jgi:hypothetical protein